MRGYGLSGTAIIARRKCPRFRLRTKRQQTLVGRVGNVSSRSLAAPLGLPTCADKQYRLILAPPRHLHRGAAGDYDSPRYNAQ